MKVNVCRARLDQDIVENILSNSMRFKAEIFADVKKNSDRADADLALLMHAMRQGLLWVYTSPMSKADMDEMTAEAKE